MSACSHLSVAPSPLPSLANAWDGTEAHFWFCVENLEHGVGLESDERVVSEVLSLAQRYLAAR
jgi:hypothetical protein